MSSDECDICGPGSPSDGLRLCPDCEVLEALVGGDIATVGKFGEQR